LRLLGGDGSLAGAGESLYAAGEIEAGSEKDNDDDESA
jgi:hypothetical protein